MPRLSLAVLLPLVPLLPLLLSCRPGRPAIPEPVGHRLPLTEPGRGFTIRDALPRVRFQNPVFAVMAARRPGIWFVGEREGRIVSVPNREDASARTTVLDLRARTLGWQDCGLLNLVFHPDFGKAGAPDRGHFYVWYNHSPRPPAGPYQPYLGAPSSNRLSRFTIPDGASAADPASELVLIDQPRNNTDHQGGGMFFHPDDGFLYLSVGDGGHPLTESRGYFWIGVTDDPQRIDRNLLSGVLRIDVDRRGPPHSHPIRRQPRHGRTQGYFIPDDNPWVDPAGKVLEEFWAIGLRNPHRLSHDPGTGRIFAGDVGDRRVEEVDVIERGGNYQWNFREGNDPGRQRRPEPLLGSERAPLFTFTHQTSGSVIGGVVYRGRRFPELVGRYLVGDNGSGQLWSLDGDGEAATPARGRPLLRLPMGMTVYAGLSSFAVDEHGEVYLCVLGDNDRGTGTLQRLVRAPQAEHPAPATLSATGLFADVAELVPAPRLFPYDVNVAFWSDHASKTRWLSLPSGKAIGYRPSGSWSFPPGTVAVKHFDLAVDERDPAARRRLETRVLVLDREGGVYGRTYKWRPDGSDADLLTAPVTERLTRTSGRPFGPLQAADGTMKTEDGRIELGTPGPLAFVHLTEPGDFDLAVAVDEPSGGPAGLMVRAGPEPAAAYLYVAREPGVPTLRVERGPGAPTRTAAAGPWIRVRRERGAITVFSGADGHLWQEIASFDDGAGPRLVGVAAGEVAAPGAATRATLGAPVRCEVRDHTYPSDTDCVACHTSAAGFVLGASTRQWNRTVASADGPVNQLLRAQARGLLDHGPTAAELPALPRLVPVDDPGAPLEGRVRSYLDVNCAQCHRPGVVAQVGFDARYETPLPQQGLVGARVRWPTVTHAADQMIYPRAPERSRLYSFLSRKLMPPMGGVLVDDAGVELLRAWIMQLPGRPALANVTIRRLGGPAPDEAGAGLVAVELSHPDPQAAIHYTVDGTGPGQDTPRYTGPLGLKAGTTLRAAAFRPGFVPSRMAALELRD